MRFLREREKEREETYTVPHFVRSPREQQQRNVESERERAEKEGWPFPGKRGWAPVPQGLLTWRERGALRLADPRVSQHVTMQMSAPAVAKHTSTCNAIKMERAIVNCIE